MKLLSCFLLFSFQSFGYLYSKSIDGSKLRWNKNTGSINLYVDTTDQSSPNINSNDVQTAVAEGISDWNASSPLKLSPIYNSTMPALGTSASFRFSNNPAFFGKGVLAVTSISYNNSDGSIYSADILMNESYSSSANFTANKSQSSGSYAYIGDVITHEIGHLLGLNHSEVQQSSMIFSIFKGQHSVHSDDKKGVIDLYDGGSNTGIKGKVVRQGLSPVYGAHVQAINLNTNEMAAGVFTEEDGSFYLKGLDPEQSYALFMSPIRSKDNLPSQFSTFQADYCGGESFEPSFFSKCGSREVGSLQAIHLSDSEVVDVGYFTIRCATPSKAGYLVQKLDNEADSYSIYDYLENYKAHASFTGYFTDSEIDDGSKADKLSLDFSGVDVASLGQTYVKISVSTEKLGSAIGLTVHAKRADEALASVHTFYADPITGKLELDHSFIKALSMDGDDNIIELEIYPIELSSTQKTEIFAASSVMTNAKTIYMLHANVQDTFGNLIKEIDDAPYEDNLECLEGEAGVGAKAYNPLSAISSSAAEQEQTFSCATIEDIDNTPGGGFGSFLIGLLMTGIIFAGCSRKDDFFV